MSSSTCDADHREGGPNILRALHAAGYYFAIVFAIGFALGTVRTFAIAPLTGETFAVAIELPVMLLASWIVCGWAIRRYQVAYILMPRLAMGVAAFGLLMGAELLVSMLIAGRSVTEHLAHYQTAPSLLGLCGQLAFALFPLLRQRDR